MFYGNIPFMHLIISIEFKYLKIKSRMEIYDKSNLSCEKKNAQNGRIRAKIPSVWVFSFHYIVGWR